MLNRLALFLIVVLFLVNACGCVALLAGAAGGVGTAVWLSEKLTQQVNFSVERTTSAAKAALRSLKLELKKETKTEEVTQLRSEYPDGKDIWIDIRKISENTSQIEVRVGAVSPDKAAADKILKRINRYLL